MLNLKYTYSLLSNSKLYTSTFASHSKIMDTLIFMYQINEFDFLKQTSLSLQNASNDKEIALLPLAVRYVSPDNSMYVIERPPCQIDVDFSANKSYDFRKSPKYLHQAKIWIPWTVSVVSTNSYLSSFASNYSFSIYFNDRPLSSFDDPMVPCFLPNSSNGSICMGQDSGPVSTLLKNNAPIVDIYNYLFNSYFSGWNCDIHNELPYNEYFTNNKIIQRIKDSKVGPKNYDALSYSRSVSKRYNQMLFLLSQLTVDEMLDYIGYCNKKAAERNHRYTRTLSNIISQYNSRNNTSVYGYRNNPTYLIDHLSNTFNSEAYNSLVAKVDISDVDTSQFNAESFYNNPYLTAKVYQKYQELNNAYYFESNVSFSLSLTFEEIAPYLSSSLQETENVISS